MKINAKILNKTIENLIQRQKNSVTLKIKTYWSDFLKSTKRPRENVVHTTETLKVICWKSRQGFPLYSLLFNIVFGVLISVKKEKVN